MSPAANRLRAYLPFQAVQPSGSTATVIHKNHQVDTKLQASTGYSPGSASTYHWPSYRRTSGRRTKLSGIVSD